MRKLVVCTLFIIVVSTFVGLSPAQISVPTSTFQAPNTVPTTMIPITLGPRIVGAKRVGASAGYGGEAPLAFEVDVDVPVTNDLRIPRPATLLLDRLIKKGPSFFVSARLATATVSQTSGPHVTVTITDPKGLFDGCETNFMRLMFEGGGSPTLLKVTPKCLFGDNGISPQQGSTPQTNIVTYNNPRFLDHAPVCGASMKMGATTKNMTSASVAGARLAIENPNGEVVPPAGGSSAPTTLPPNGDAPQVAATPPFTGQSGRWTLRVAANVSADKIYQPGFFVHVTRLCTLTTEFARSAPPICTALYGQACTTNTECCDGVPCTGGHCRAP